MVMSYDATTPIVPQTAVTNSDLIALFFPYKEDKTLDLAPGRERRFDDPGDITIGASDQEQTVLEIGGKYTYEVNGKVSQGEITFPYNPDPNKGPAKIYTDTMSVAMSPQGCLYLCKKLNEEGTELQVWGLIGCNFVVGRLFLCTILAKFIFGEYAQTPVFYCSTHTRQVFRGKYGLFWRAWTI